MKNKVLLVDDDPTLVRFLAQYLEGESFEVVTAHNGTDALKQVYASRPDLVVLDVMMPGMDGYEVTARLREMSHIPIILLTAKSTEADKLRGFRLGVDDYVTKPFSFAELAARIQAVLSRIPRVETSERKMVQFGEFGLDLDNRELRRGSERISLTPTEFRLLECLAAHPGKAISEAELMQEVWGSYRQEDSTAVRRYIWLLRKKIESDPSQPEWIETVRGFGYRLGTGSLPPHAD